MNIADYKKFDVINGTGLRHSIFTSGCQHHCKGCFNPLTWNFNYGTPYTQSFEDQVIRDLNIEYVRISGLSILGGEPFQNVDGLLGLVKRIKNECVGKDIWIWSGYTYEELITDDSRLALLSYCDVLIDGKFKLEQRNLKLTWRGSENQRVLDVQQSLSQGQAIGLGMF
ncbi:anaerobic ribonucleoside-triphosphate reductase activating protein [Paenibacillus macquariensis]|uniref:Anaerobic ribonucleoside-triphosphate reductase-activating protein n=1 Tax=Paenibacillus macquariensis TaxID=948756 RepID=A0ABY1K3A3_9BACL|nr:anaerobic ribonucleoside-triphosphate reductase activating protein [Paenibacillus macquariensis]MEC0090318.1 anaerobic ribonucleoside-triphosphate reductase activating protein [Paenibacillus macquariensis]OAB39675.1 anaerobic ribonucleoside-triphosphate reductase activating protein [Paenibacillus macquariensis subsp. macquariensis]SIR19369.1 ribonucleoside-triphosphate reductase class III activase subunit [Paenibacillus macquariensis]